MSATITQRMLRPIINYIVETVFPEGAFFGNDFFRPLESNVELVEKWGSTEMSCAMFITSSVRDYGATRAVFEASDITSRGEHVGSWRMTVEKITAHEP